MKRNTAPKNKLFNSAVTLEEDKNVLPQLNTQKSNYVVDSPKNCKRYLKLSDNLSPAK